MSGGRARRSKHHRCRYRGAEIPGALTLFRREPGPPQTNRGYSWLRSSTLRPSALSLHWAFELIAVQCCHWLPRVFRSAFTQDTLSIRSDLSEALQDRGHLSSRWRPRRRQAPLRSPVAGRTGWAKPHSGAHDGPMARVANINNVVDGTYSCRVRSWGSCVATSVIRFPHPALLGRIGDRFLAEARRWLARVRGIPCGWDRRIARS